MPTPLLRPTNLTSRTLHPLAYELRRLCLLLLLLLLLLVFSCTLTRADMWYFIHRAVDHTGELITKCLRESGMNKTDVRRFTT